MRRIAGIAVCLIVMGSQPAWAARLQVHEMAESDQYGRKVGGMIARGALNAVTCFVDPVVNIVNETKAGPPVIGTLTGVAKGVGCGILRLGSGALDLVTFWVPGFNGFPVSDSYENCLAGTGSRTASVEVLPPTETQAPAVAGLDIPTTEPGAAQAPQPAVAVQPRPKKHWTK